MLPDSMREKLRQAAKSHTAVRMDKIDEVIREIHEFCSNYMIKTREDHTNRKWADKPRNRTRLNHE